MGKGRAAGLVQVVPADLVRRLTAAREVGNVFSANRQHQLSANDRRQLYAVSVIAGPLQPGPAPAYDVGRTAAVFLDSVGGSILWIRGLVSEQRPQLASAAFASGDEPRNRPGVFECARSAGSVGRSEV